MIVSFVACGGGSRVEKRNAFGGDLAKHGMWDEAAYHWEQVLAQNPDDFKALNNLAVFAMREGAFEQAEDYFNRAQVVAPENSSVKENLEALQEFLAEHQQYDPEKEKKQRLLPQQGPFEEDLPTGYGLQPDYTEADQKTGGSES